VGVGIGPLSLSYGSGGFNAGLGIGVNQGGLGFNFGGINYGANGFGLSGPSVSYGSLFQYGEISAGNTNQPGKNGDLQGGTDGTVKGNTGLYEDETNAYNVMVEQTQFTGVETAAWLTDKGVLMSPISYGDIKNTATGSDNGYYRITARGKNFYAHSRGEKLRITGQVHTHPSSDIGPWYKSGGKVYGGDYKFAQTFRGLSVYTIGPKNVHQGIFNGIYNAPNLVGATSSLLSGKFKLRK